MLQSAPLGVRMQAFQGIKQALPVSKAARASTRSPVVVEATKVSYSQCMSPAVTWPMRVRAHVIHVVLHLHV